MDYPEIEAKQVSIVESLLPPEILKLPADLVKVKKQQNFDLSVAGIELYTIDIGTATDARMYTTARTIISSIRVNPFFTPRIVIDLQHAAFIKLVLEWVYATESIIIHALLYSIYNIKKTPQLIKLGG